MDRSTCTRCGKAFAARSARCPYCNAANSTHRPDADLAIETARLMAGERHLAREEGRRATGLHTALWALAMPTVVPGLLLLRVMAKRWGRVDSLSALAPATLVAGVWLVSVLTGRASLLPWLPLAISLAAGIALVLLRAHVEPRGIAFGYSGTVIHTGMAAGWLLLLGYVAFALIDGTAILGSLAMGVGLLLWCGSIALAFREGAAR